MNMYSINYVHQGASKIWYSIRPEDGENFERFVYTPETDKLSKCKKPLLHKWIHVKPDDILENNIQVYIVLPF